MGISFLGYQEGERLYLPAHLPSLPLYTYRRRTTSAPSYGLNGFTIDIPKDGSIILAMNFAGYEKDDIHVTFDQQTGMMKAFTDCANCKSQEETTDSEETPEKENPCGANCRCNTITESNCKHLLYRYKFRQGTRLEDISTEYKNGMLTLTVAPPSEGMQEGAVKLEIN